MKARVSSRKRALPGRADFGLDFMCRVARETMGGAPWYQARRRFN